MARSVERVPLRRVLREWSRIGLFGFGGPPTHIAMLRKTCVEDNEWIDAREFEDAIAVCNLLPGPASTQLAIHSARSVSGWRGAIVGGLAFICPGLVIITALSALFLAGAPPVWVLSLGAGAGAAIPAVALGAAFGLARTSLTASPSRRRWAIYVSVGVVCAATAGPFVVVALLACGLCEIVVVNGSMRSLSAPALGMVGGGVAVGGFAALIVVALKVGALSYGGGFVIIPLMQHDAVSVHHWMTNSQFLNAVALGQVTPGPVVLTVAVVGFAAFGVGGAISAAAIAFAPSFVFILVGGSHFPKFRTATRPRQFLTGAGPAAIGAILGATIPLTRSLAEGWQYALLALAVLWIVMLRRGVVVAIVACGVAGIGAHLFGLPLP